MRWEGRKEGRTRGGRQDTVIFNVRHLVYRRYMHASQNQFRILSFEDVMELSVTCHLSKTTQLYQAKEIR
jgi:hypothetical protein